MIFAHTIDKVLSGEKTQTRRLAKPRTIPPPEDASPCGETDGDWLWDCHGTAPLTVFSAKPCKPGEGFWGLGYTPAKPKYRVGSQYSVQPGRGMKGLARIEITGIRKEDVREISDEDAKAEGFYNAFDFLQTWTKMHDPAFKFWFNPSIADYEYKIGRKHEIVGWDTLQEVIQSRPADRYQVWVLEFRLVEGGS